MNRNSMNTCIRTLFALALAAGLAACAATTPTATVEDTPKAPQFEPWDGDGMEIPLDGSSLESFETSMARVKAYSTPANYTTFNNAVEYLLVYDLGVRRDKTKLAAKLDGKTPYQVVEMVQWRKPAPGKSTAEKGAADATIDL